LKKRVVMSISALEKKRKEGVKRFGGEETV